MNQSELLVKSELEREGFNVTKHNNLGLPDFYCDSKNESFYAEVKTKKDGLRIDQILKIDYLIRKGYKLYLFIVEDDIIHKYKLFIDITKENINDIVIKLPLNLKKVIFDYIKNLNEQTTYIGISKALKISYPTILKYCEILLMEGKIQVKDYGNVKLVSPIK